MSCKCSVSSASKVDVIGVGEVVQAFLDEILEFHSWLPCRSNLPVNSSDSRSFPLLSKVRKSEVCLFNVAAVPFNSCSIVNINSRGTETIRLETLT